MLTFKDNLDAHGLISLVWITTATLLSLSWNDIVKMSWIHNLRDILIAPAAEHTLAKLDAATLVAMTGTTVVTPYHPCK